MSVLAHYEYRLVNTCQPPCSINYSLAKNIQAETLTVCDLVEKTLDGVLHEAADGHRTDTARDRGDD